MKMGKYSCFKDPNYRRVLGSIARWTNRHGSLASAHELIPQKRSLNIPLNRVCLLVQEGCSMLYGQLLKKPNSEALASQLSTVATKVSPQPTKRTVEWIFDKMTLGFVNGAFGWERFLLHYRKRKIG